MGSGNSIPADKHIVIVGGGYGGVDLSLRLLKHGVNFTLIDAKDVMHHNVASVRAVSQPGFAKQTVIPYAPVFGEHFVQGVVTEIDTANKQVKLHSRNIAYDVLVLATGSRGQMKEWEGSGEEIVKKYAQIANEVQKSGRIVVIGGGAAGVEVACEITTDFSDKNVTIVHSSNTLVLPNAPQKFTKQLLSMLDKLRVKVVLGETVTNMEELPNGIHGVYTVKTTSGQSIEADLVIHCTGLQVNTTAYASTLGDHMEGNGSLRVSDTFLVEGYNDIFAIGDCTNTTDGKLAFIALQHSEFVWNNLPRMLRGKEMKKYQAGTSTFLIGLALGRNHAIATTRNGFIMPEFILVQYKSKDLMVGRFFSQMKQKVPDIN